MKPERIERSHESAAARGITPEEIREGLARTAREKAQPGYEAREKARIAEAERRAKTRGTKFPELAKRPGTAPSITERRARLIEKTASAPRPPRKGFTQD